MNLGVDPKHSDQMVRGVVSMPKGTGKTARVAVFAKDEKAEEAKAAGADLVGSDDLAEKVDKGEINFDRIIATPDMMAIVGKLGKVLGPRGLMPNPKLGSVTLEIDKAVKSIKAGLFTFFAYAIPFSRSSKLLNSSSSPESTGIIHAGLGKVSFGEKDILENISSFIDSVRKSKPSGSKGQFLKRINLSTTMGPSIKIDLSSLDAASS